MSNAVQRKGLMHLGGGGGKTLTWGALCVECPAGNIAGLSPVAPCPSPPSLPSVEIGSVMPNIYPLLFLLLPYVLEGGGTGTVVGRFGVLLAPQNPCGFCSLASCFFFLILCIFFGSAAPVSLFLMCMCVRLAASSSHLLLHGST